MNLSGQIKVVFGVTRHAEQQIVQLITLLKGWGIRLFGFCDGVRPQRLQVMIDKADETPVTIEDCTEVSHMVSALLDVEDPITGTLFGGQHPY